MGRDFSSESARPGAPRRPSTGASSLGTLDGMAVGHRWRTRGVAEALRPVAAACAAVGLASCSLLASLDGLSGGGRPDAGTDAPRMVEDAAPRGFCASRPDGDVLCADFDALDAGARGVPGWNPPSLGDAGEQRVEVVAMPAAPSAPNALEMTVLQATAPDASPGYLSMGRSLPAPMLQGGFDFYAMVWVDALVEGDLGEIVQFTFNADTLRVRPSSFGNDDDNHRLYPAPLPRQRWIALHVSVVSRPGDAASSRALDVRVEADGQSIYEISLPPSPDVATLQAVVLGPDHMPQGSRDHFLFDNVALTAK